MSKSKYKCISVYDVKMKNNINTCRLDCNNKNDIIIYIVTIYHAFVNQHCNILFVQLHFRMYTYQISSTCNVYSLIPLYITIDITVVIVFFCVVYT